MSVAIKVENLSKAYQLGEIGTGTLSRDLERWFAKLRGKEDPFLKIGQANDRTVKGTSDVVWSLKDLNFELNQGDAVGIIGRNGAGKSTLLKLLSRVTAPTSGNIKVKGRIASLLEVGTGFHPELTGRENIFLNGAILGMRKREIARKFDEIVDFAGVDRYIDTPVKRYSSGMYVRLAFAVAAYLESEILIVDEVLAVGDAEFQNKCLGKMSDISKGEGRTVLFVSHNMVAVESLCNKGLLLKNGKIAFEGNVLKVVGRYLTEDTSNASSKEIIISRGKITVEVLNEQLVQTNKVKLGEHLYFRFKFRLTRPLVKPNIGIGINNRHAQRIVTYHTKYQLIGDLRSITEEGITCEVPKVLLMPGKYFVEISLFEDTHLTIFNQINIFEIEVQETNLFGTGKLPDPAYQGMVVSEATWKVHNGGV